MLSESDGLGVLTIRWGPPPKQGLVPTLVAGLIGVAGLCGAIYASLFAQPWVSGGVAFAILGGYLLLSYLFRPAPDMDNLGWFGGMVDDPFKFGDGFNRSMLVLMLVLLPGRFVSTSVTGLILYPFRGQADDAHEA